MSIRQQRPLRAATGSDDASLVFYHGAPFKFNTSLRGQHNRFIYGVAFSPDGTLLVSVGADKKIWLYDGKTGEVKGQVGDGEHKGSIFSVSWAGNSRSFVTSSADQTVKIWDVASGKPKESWQMGDEGVISVPDHQVGVVWPFGRSDGLIISLNLAGDLTYLREGTRQPQKVVQGHQKNITAISANSNATAPSTFWTGSSEGRVYSWDASSGNAEAVDGENHTNYIAGIAASVKGHVYSVGWDDTLRSIDQQGKTFVGGSTKIDGQPKGVATSAEGKIVVATHKGIEIFAEASKTNSDDLKTKYTPSAIAFSGKTVAVGGDDYILHLYSMSSNSLAVTKEITEAGSLITTLAFSPDRSLLAVGFSNGKITVYKCEDWSVAITRWSSHTARITSIAWDASGNYAVSSSLDTNVFVWSVAKPGTRINASNAHKDGVNGVTWVNGQRLIASVGGDAAVKLWKVEGLS